jgi:large subunit ribosomal protein L33
MAKTKSKSKYAGMVCQVCNERRYVTRRNTVNTPDLLEIKKYCPNCRKHTDHKETKKNLGRNEAPKRK